MTFQPHQTFNIVQKFDGISIPVDTFLDDVESMIVQGVVSRDDPSFAAKCVNAAETRLELISANGHYALEAFKSLTPEFCTWTDFKDILQHSFRGFNTKDHVQLARILLMKPVSSSEDH